MINAKVHASKHGQDGAHWPRAAAAVAYALPLSCFAFADLLLAFIANSYCGTCFVRK
ncbi:unnamed protein product [Ectocarpus sp. 6 AP-2014]